MIWLSWNDIVSISRPFPAKASPVRFEVFKHGIGSAAGKASALPLNTLSNTGRMGTPGLRYALDLLGINGSYISLALWLPKVELRDA